MKIKDHATYFLLKILSKWIRYLSHNSRIKFTNGFASFIYNFIPIRKKQAFTNIKKAFPEKSNAWIKSTLKNTYKIVTENFIDLLGFPKSYDFEMYKVTGQKILNNALKKEKGVILVTGHFGLWEKWGAWLGNNKYKVWGIIQRQGNAGADLFFKEMRESYGMNHIYRKSSLDQSYKALKQNEILILASDQDAKKRGVFVNFFNHPSSVPKGTALFHLKTKAPIIFSVGHKEVDGSFSISFQEVETNEKSTIETITQKYTSLLEKEVRNYPDHYFWFHRKWKTKIN